MHAVSRTRFRPPMLFSAASRVGLSVLFVLAAILFAFLPTMPVAADPARGIRVAIDHPIAIRGSTLFIPLEAEQSGNQWPSIIPITFADGSVIEGDVVLLSARGKPPLLDWTTELLGLHIRGIAPDDDPSTGVGSPFLIAPLPVQGSGELRILGRTIAPRWFNRVFSPTRWETDNIVVEPLPMEPGPHRPDPNSPFEYWRWVLCADRVGLAPPPPAGNRIERLLAVYYADLWRFGLERISSVDPVTAYYCRDLLTRTGMDRQREIAVWEADPEALANLLGILLDLDREARDAARHARDWCMIRQRVLIWIEEDHGPQLEIAALNNHDDFLLAEFRWEFLDPARNAREFPLGVGLEPNTTTRVRVNRPSVQLDMLGRPLPGPPPLLQVRVEDDLRRFMVRGAEQMAIPPGVFFVPFHAPLSLAEIRAGQAGLVNADRATSAVLRRLGGRWEIFFTCFRPGAAPTEHISRFIPEEPPEPIASPAYPFAGKRDVEEIRGVESVTIFLGSEQEPTAVLTIPETGMHRLWTGQNDGTLQVHRRSYGDRWYARIVLPDGWLRYPYDRGTLIGLARAHGDSPTVETSPNPSAPWLIRPGRVFVNTTFWSDLPQ